MALVLQPTVSEKNRITRFNVLFKLVSRWQVLRWPPTKIKSPQHVIVMPVLITRQPLGVVLVITDLYELGISKLMYNLHIIKIFILDV